MKVIYISCVEEMVLNPQFKGSRIARIEVALDGEHYPVEVGRITVWNNDELFDYMTSLIEKHGGETIMTLVKCDAHSCVYNEFDVALSEYVCTRGNIKLKVVEERSGDYTDCDCFEFPEEVINTK